MNSQILMWFADLLGPSRQVNDEEGDKTSPNKDNHGKSRAVLLKDQVVDYIIDNILPGGRNGRLHKMWTLFGNEAAGILVSLTEVIMLFVTTMAVYHVDEEIIEAICGTQCDDVPYDDDVYYDCESDCYICCYDNWIYKEFFFRYLFPLRFAAEILAWGLALLLQKYRRIGVTPLSLEWQPGNFIDLCVIPSIQIIVGAFATGLNRYMQTSVFVPVLCATMMGVGVFTLGWTWGGHNELVNEGPALVGSVAVTRLVAFTWEIWSVSMDIIYLATFSSKLEAGKSVVILLFVELSRTAWEFFTEIRDAKITYICGKILIPIRSLDVFESLNTYRAEALKSNARVDGVIAVTSRWVPTDKTVDAIQNLVPILEHKGPLAGGDWLSHLGGNSRDALFQVRLAISGLFDSKKIVAQDDRLYVITSPQGSTLECGLVIEKDGSTQFSNNIVLDPGKCCRWKRVRITKDSNNLGIEEEGGKPSNEEGT